MTIGGGSAIGLGRNIALAIPIRHVAIPTTYSGSEMTAIHGMTVTDRKQTGKDPAKTPRRDLRPRPEQISSDGSHRWERD